MIGNGDGGRNGAGIGVLARAVADAVPGIVEQLCASNNPRVHREALALLERPLLAHVLALTGGNQLRAARRIATTVTPKRSRIRASRRERSVMPPAPSASSCTSGSATAATPPASARSIALRYRSR